MLDPTALAAYCAWPVFSGDCFLLVHSLLKQGVRPHTVIDVGANIGQFAVAAGKLLKPAVTYSFEPLPECYTLLCRNVRKLGVRTLPLALGDANGESVLHVTQGTFASSCLPPTATFQSEWPDAREVATRKVTVSTLDRELGDVEFKPPTLLKLDVQGYEAQVLRGAQDLLKRVDWIVLETGFAVRYEGETLFSELLRIVEGYGFRFLRPLKFNAHPETDEITEMDALFERQERPYSTR
jgi:FkbM family methyltransferase